MIDLTTLKTEVEIQSPSVSYNNVTKLRQFHGDIIAVIHCIGFNEHTTQFIYFDGYVHDSNGFKLVVPENDLDHQKIACFLLLLQSLPCLGPQAQDILFEYLSSKIENDKVHYFVFRAGLHYMPINNIYMNCDGMKTLDEIISYIFQDENCIITETEK